jgi:RNA polymerase sigma-70 factor (ECF subfamily)
MDRDIPLTHPSAAGDRFDDVLEKYGRFLGAAIARMVPKDMAADYDDIRQEACIRLWRALSSGREFPSLASYIYRGAATTTIDAIRRVKARREETLEAPDSGEEPPVLAMTATADAPDRVAAYRELQAKVSRALGHLPTNQRRAVRLHLHGLTTTEIGSLLGWTEAKARNLVHRARKDLRERLRAEGIDYESH